MFGLALPASAPGWLIGLAALSSAATVLLLGAAHLVRATLPQNSADRLAWWTEKRNHDLKRKTLRRATPACDTCRHIIQIKIQIAKPYHSTAQPDVLGWPHRIGEPQSFLQHPYTD
jgi:hypothetical protein